MDQQEERPRPYNGYVIGAVTIPNNTRGVLWKVRVQTPGDFFERRVTIEHGSVPKGIFTGMDVRFNLVTIGRNGVLVATDVEAYVRQSGIKEERTGR